jgi:YEATS domain-containing protein 4
VLVITDPPFEVSENGWGEFVIHIKITFKNARFKPLSLSHQLHLHHPLTANPKLDAPVVSQIFDEIIFYDLPANTDRPQVECQPCMDPEALKELENLDRIIAHFGNLLESGAS